MDCLARGKQFAGHHTTRLVWHFAKKLRPGGIAICTYAFSEDKEIQFMDLLQQREEGPKKSDPEGETWGWHVVAFDLADPEEDEDMEPFDMEIVHEHLEGADQKEEI